MARQGEEVRGEGGAGASLLRHELGPLSRNRSQELSIYIFNNLA